MYKIQLDHYDVNREWTSSLEILDLAETRRYLKEWGFRYRLTVFNNGEEYMQEVWVSDCNDRIFLTITKG